MGDKFEAGKWIVKLEYKTLCLLIFYFVHFPPMILPSSETTDPFDYHWNEIHSWEKPILKSPITPAFAICLDTLYRQLEYSGFAIHHLLFLGLF